MEKLEIQFKEESNQRKTQEWLSAFAEKHKDETDAEFTAWLNK